MKTYNASTVLSMFKMVENERADFTLQDFDDVEDFDITMEKITLTLLPNIKVILEGSRNFVVSKHNRNSKDIYQALSSGLKN